MRMGLLGRFISSLFSADEPRCDWLGKIERELVDELQQRNGSVGLVNFSNT